MPLRSNPKPHPACFSSACFQLRTTSSPPPTYASALSLIHLMLSHMVFLNINCSCLSFSSPDPLSEMYGYYITLFEHPSPSMVNHICISVCSLSFHIMPPDLTKNVSRSFYSFFIFSLSLSHSYIYGSIQREMVWGNVYIIECRLPTQTWTWAWYESDVMYILAWIFIHITYGRRRRDGSLSRSMWEGGFLDGCRMLLWFPKYCGLLTYLKKVKRNPCRGKIGTQPSYG